MNLRNGWMVGTVCGLAVMVMLGSARADADGVESVGHPATLPASTASAVVAELSPSAQSQAIEDLREQLHAEQVRTQALEQRLDELEREQQGNQGTIKSLQTTVGRGPEVTAGAAQKTEADIYDKGFYLRSRSGRFSLYINVLSQLRYTFFKPNAVSRFGSNNPAISNFDVYLGRLALSGSAFAPDLKYFLQLQTSTAGNGNTVSLLDWFTSKTINRYLTVQMGRSWPFYTYEYYDNPGNLLLPDLSTAEYAFLLNRAIGFQAAGQAGKLGYGFEVANSIPAIDASGQENMHGQMAYIANLHYDILQPYGWVESDPSRDGAGRPELSLWASGMYNPVEYASGFQNEQPGDKVFGATPSINFRYRYFTFQGTGYYRRTIEHASLPSYDSWGYGEQAGYYIVPATWELAERVSGVWWGRGEIPTTGGTQTDWFSGPTNFPYHRITEFTAGLNYYLYGHNAKVQAAYSYLAGSSFNDEGFGANRFWLQTQVMF